MKYLVLDLDKTLIFRNKIDNTYLKRPYLDVFLNEIKHFYKLILFTAGNKNYYEHVLNITKIKNYFHKEYCNKNLIKNKKDLSILKKNFSKIILVDDKKKNFKQLKNGILIKEFCGNKKDKKLLLLKRILIKIWKYDDVRKGISDNKKEINKLSE